jgi:hypothetical protein
LTLLCRYIRWDVPPLDEVYENLRAVEEQHAKEFPPPFLEKVKNNFSIFLWQQLI